MSGYWANENFTMEFLKFFYQFFLLIFVRAESIWNFKLPSMKLPMHINLRIVKTNCFSNKIIKFFVM